MKRDGHAEHKSTKAQQKETKNLSKEIAQKN